MKEEIKKIVEKAVLAIETLKQEKSICFIEDCAKMICEAFLNGNKIIVAGNGGSMCDASHFAEELTGFFREKRKAFPAIVLSEVGHLTCVGNDIGFDFVFSRGVEAFGKRDDIFIALTTSGNSQNLVNAVDIAKKMGLKTVCFLGKTGGSLKDCADLEFLVANFDTSDRIQEVHMAAIHIIIEQVEKLIFSKDVNKAKTTIFEKLLNTVKKSYK